MSSIATRTSRLQEIQSLRRSRPRNQVLRITLMTLGVLALYAWTSGEIATTDFFTQRRLDNLRSFVSEELVPFELREGGASFGAYLTWAAARWREHGASAVLATLQISIVAIVIAGVLGWCFAPLLARNVASAKPFAADSRSRPSLRRGGYGALRFTSRALAILMRAVPEYILAFLLLALLGPGTAWPAVLALAIHNAGILGKLTGETIENLEPAPLRALSGLGARRRSVVLFGVFPLSLGRFLLYFFYRFETCVREATVLGMLGVVSLGYWIQDARARLFYDQMVFLVGLGVVLVLAADLTSALARHFLRKH